MQKIILATVLAALGSASALAADFAPRAYTKAPVMAASVSTWSGFYVGGGVGARSSNVDWKSLDLFGVAALNTDNPSDLSNTSVRAGGYVGYNWMVSPSFLLGLEADIAYGNNNRTHTGLPGNPFAMFTGVGHDFATAKLGWDGSVRGRLGALVAPNWLLYTTGGVAWQQIETKVSCDAADDSICGIASSSSTSSTKAGWTVGGGIETMLGSHWLARLEYRYADFGRVGNTLTHPGNLTIHSDITVKTNTALAGIAYKF